MAATLVRLRWRLTLNAVRSSVWAVIGLLAGGAYAVGAVSVLTGGAVLLGAAGDVTSVSLVLGALGALLVAGWTLVPLLLTGQDGTLDPRALAAWVAPSRTLARGLLVAAACGLPGLATGVVCLLPLLVWALSGQWAAVASALVMAPVALATCVVLSRVVVTAAGLSTTRRGRDRVALVAVAAVLLGSLVPSLLNGLALGEGLGALRPVARAVGLTPLGWTFAVPGLVATGQWALAAACALGAVALPVLLMALWYRVVRRVMVTPVSGSGPSHGYVVVTGQPDRSSSAAGPAGDAAGTDAVNLVDVLPWARRLGRLMPVPAAAVAARCLRYWRTDPRYLAQLLGLCLVPALLVVVAVMGPAAGTSVVEHLAWGGAPAGLLALPVVLGLLTGWSLHDDLGYDSTARWSHLSTALRGRDDLLGRIVAAALWQIPVIVVSTLLVAGWTGHWRWAPVVLGTALALLGCAYGWSAVTSVLMPYEVNAPGDSPLRSRTSGTALLASLVQMAGWIVLATVTAPVWGAGILVVLAGSWAWGTAVALLGLGWGLAGTCLGVHRAGVLLERRGARLLATIRSWPGHDQPG